jgi:hypothetical protein
MTLNFPSGRQYQFASEPTQEEVDQVVAYDSSLPPETALEEPKQSGVIDRIKKTFINANKSDDQKGRELFNALDQELVKSGDLTSEQANAIKNQPMAGDVNTISEAAANVAEKAAPTIARIGLPLAAGIISSGVEAGTAGVATPAVIAFMGFSADMGERVARQLEGRAPPSLSEEIQTFGLGGLMGPVKAPVGVTNWLAGSLSEAGAYAAHDAQQRGVSLDPTTLAINAAMSLGARGFESASIANVARQKQIGYDLAMASRKAERTAADAKRMDDLASSGLRDVQSTEGAVTPFDYFVYEEGVRKQQAPIIAAREAAASAEATRISELAVQSNARKASVEAERKLASANAELQVAGTDPFIRNPEFVKTRENTNLSDMIGREATYANHSGRVIRDAEGNFGLLKEVVKKGEANFVEIENSGKNPSLLADDVGIVPKEGWDRPVAVNQSPEIIDSIVQKNNLADDFNRQVNELNVHEQITNGLPVVTTPPKVISGTVKDQFRNQYGRIDPAIVYAMSRAGLGFAAGVAIGDTPEEDLGYGLGLAVMGASLSPSLAKKLGRSAMDKFKRTNVGEKSIGTSNKLVPEILMDPFMTTVHSTQDDAKALLVRTSFAKTQLEKALNGVDDLVARQRTSDAVFDYMTKGTQLSQLPVFIQNAALNAREAISELSDILISRGVAKGTLVNTLTANRDTYLRRAYKIFLDDNYKPSQIDQNNWINANVSKELSNPNNLKTRDLLVKQFTEDLSDMLDRKVAGNYVLFGNGKGRNNIFTARDNTIDALTRKVYGEINDPIALLGDTATRMANAAASFKANTEIAAIGEKLELFKKTPPDAFKWKRLSVESDLDSPFSGLWATKEMADAMQSVRSSSSGNAVTQVWSTVNSLMKAAVTLGSLKTHAGNVWGAFNDIVANGHAFELIRPSNWKTGLTNAGMTFGVYEKNGRLSVNKGLKVYEDFVREGLIDKSVSGHDFSNSFRHSFFEKHLGITIIDKPLDVFRSGMSTLGKIYSAPETFGKVFNVAGEVRALKAANTGMTDQAIFKEAAAKVRATTSTPREQWKIVKQLSIAGAIDPFIAYTIDRYRVVYNTFKIAGSEIKSTNAGIRAMGYKRALSMTTLLGAGAAAGANFAIPKDQEKALRNRVPNYAKYGTLYLTPPDKDGNFTFTNLNNLLPHTIVIEAAMAAMRGDNVKEAFSNFFGALTNQAFGENLGFNILSQVKQNETTRGVQIKSDSDSDLTQLKDIGSFVLNEGFLPAAFGELARIKQSWDQPITSPSGRVVTRDDLFLSNFAGMRVMRMNLDDRIKSEVKAISSQIGKDNLQYNTNYKNAISDSDRNNLYQNKLSRDGKNFVDTQSLFRDSLTLGLSNDKIAGIARDSGMPARISLGAIDGIYIPPKQEKDKSPTDLIHEMIEDGSDQKQVLAQIKTIAGKDLVLARSLMENYRTMVIEFKKGITDQDKLLRSFSETNGDRANYIAKKVKLISDQQGPMMGQSYLIDLRKKGVLTPGVNARLKSLGVSIQNKQ